MKRRSLKEYEEAWIEHTEDLRGLKWNLPKTEDRKKLEKSISEIKKIIQTAKADLREKRYGRKK